MLKGERELFEAAIDVDAAGREQFVRNAAGDDHELAERVLNLLEAHDRAQSTPNHTAGVPEAVAAAAASDMLRAGDSVGRYHILEKIGEGGFGEVYVAEQREPVKRRVALKILKPGMDTKAVLARFKAEQQALALMDHPNIARVLDADSTDNGRPYFVMELVKGEPITSYCDRHMLSTAERLALFIPVCDAVQHAHQRGVIHRDLKPSNILVAATDGDPVARVIDFGIAKATSGSLTDETLYTHIGLFMGTPEFMSPEQAEGSADVDTRTDVYSLGAVLYTLLCGALPFDAEQLRGKAYPEVQRILREEDPPTPSARVSTAGDAGQQARRSRTDAGSLARELKGELDWIVLKAMDKDRTRRYETASGLGDDIRRHLQHEPVVAGPPSSSYRLGKFVRRNRTFVAAGSLVAVALVIGTIFALLGLDRAIKAERLAVEEAEKAKTDREIAEAVNEFLNKDLLAAVAPSGEQGRGRGVMMRDVLDRAAQSIEEASQPGGRFADKPLVEAAIRKTLGDTYKQLGVLDIAEPHYVRALQLREQHLGERHADTIESLSNMGNLRYFQYKYDEAKVLLQRTADLRREVLGLDHIHTAWAIHDLGNCFFVDPDYERAEELWTEAYEIKVRLLGGDHWDTLLTMNNLALVYKRLDRWDEAEAMTVKTLESQTRLRGSKHPDTMLSMSNLAKLYRERGRYDESEALYTETLALNEEVLGAGHPETLQTRAGLTRVFLDTGHVNKAERSARRMLEVSAAGLGEDHNRTRTACEMLSECLETQGRYREAIPFRRRVLESRQRVFGDDDKYTNMGRYRLACAELGAGHPDAAIRQLQDAVAHGFQAESKEWADDPALAALKGTPEFDAIVGGARQ